MHVQTEEEEKEAVTRERRKESGAEPIWQGQRQLHRKGIFGIKIPKWSSFLSPHPVVSCFSEQLLRLVFSEHSMPSCKASSWALGSRNGCRMNWGCKGSITPSTASRCPRCSVRDSSECCGQHTVRMGMCALLPISFRFFFCSFKRQCGYVPGERERDREREYNIYKVSVYSRCLCEPFAYVISVSSHKGNIQQITVLLKNM